MIERFVLSFVEKLILLEKASGATIPYRIAGPITTPLHDVIAIQKLAHQLGSSIGLSNYVFVVSVAKQKKNVGGHIDLSTRGDEVFIEIDPGVNHSPDSIGATLCHEICHKWLQIRGITSPILMDNEILTDITTIFLGFGKIMLNGCEVTSVTTEKVADGIRKETNAHKFGYLNRDQLAFVYRLVCSMRKIPESEYMQGLNFDAVSAIRMSDRLFGESYGEKFHDAETNTAALERLGDVSLAHQQLIAKLDKHLAYISRAYCDTVGNTITHAQATVERISRRSNDLAKSCEFDPALLFLVAIRKCHEVELMHQELASMSKSLEEFLTHSKLIGSAISNSDSHFPPPSARMFNIVICPRDGTKLRLPEDSPNLLVGCPTCHYQFVYDTTCICFGAPAREATTENTNWLTRLWKKLGGASKSSTNCLL